jgi:hypothetical protein
MTLAELWDLLTAVDWYYQMADDGRAYAAGQRGFQAGMARADELGEAGRRMWAAFDAHHGAGGTAGCPALPARPAD